MFHLLTEIYTIYIYIYKFINRLHTNSFIRAIRFKTKVF